MADDYFDQIKALVPWLTPYEASELLNEFEIQFFAAHPEYLFAEEIFNATPEYLELCEKKQNDMVLKAFKESHHVRRH